MGERRRFGGRKGWDSSSSRRSIRRKWQCPSEVSANRRVSCTLISLCLLNRNILKNSFQFRFVVIWSRFSSICENSCYVKFKSAVPIPRLTVCWWRSVFWQLTQHSVPYNIYFWPNREIKAMFTLNWITFHGATKSCLVQYEQQRPGAAQV